LLRSRTGDKREGGRDSHGGQDRSFQWFQFHVGFFLCCDGRLVGIDRDGVTGVVRQEPGLAPPSGGVPFDTPRPG
jgi:hypothetical protein